MRFFQSAVFSDQTFISRNRQSVIIFFIFTPDPLIIADPSVNFSIGKTVFWSGKNFMDGDSGIFRESFSKCGCSQTVPVQDCQSFEGNDFRSGFKINIFCNRILL